jgi:chemotaxis protein MotB
MSTSQQPIVVIKKKSGHGGHHGGAWKVAYADFVTAMMALFIVLWLTSSTSTKEKKVIAGYFKDPLGTSQNKGTDLAGSDENITLKPQDMSKLKDALLHSVRQVNDLRSLEKQIDMIVTPEGLRIELMESPNGTFFESGSPLPKPALTALLTTLSGQLGKLPNRISIEGHTDAAPYAKNGAYSNWELSADRANTSRRLMEAHGVRHDQVEQVRGFADQRLRHPDKPFEASNRRVSLVVEYIPEKPAAGAHPSAPEAAPGTAAPQPVTTAAANTHPALR